MKQCHSCHKLLDNSQFRINKLGHLMSHCKGCEQYKHDWYITHRKEQKLKRKENYSTHKHEYTQRSTQWQQEHQKERKVYLQQYYKEHHIPSDRILKLPEEKKAYERQRASVRRKANFNYTRKMWEDVKDLFNHRCAYCLRPTKRLTVDHIIPVSKGGLTTEDNVVPACQRCNNKKLNRSLLQIAGVNFVEAS